MKATQDTKATLITGGTKGIGLAIARKIARPGAQLFLSYRSDDVGAEKARQSLADSGATVHLIRQNISTAEEARKVVDEVARHVSRLHGLVHCAAVPNPGWLVEQDLDEVRETIRIGGFALLYLVQPAIKLMSEGGRIIFISGGAVEIALPQHGALALAKAAGDGIVRYLSIECAPLKIGINSLRAGPVDTDLYRASRPDGTPPAVTPMGRVLSAEDVGNAAAFLLSDDSAMVHGTQLMVDGGTNATVRRERIPAAKR